MSHINIEDSIARKVRHIGARFASTELTLVGEYSVSPESGAFHFLNPGGVNRTVRLPPLEPGGGQLYIIMNTGTATLNVVTVEGVAVGALLSLRTGLFTSSPTLWRASIVAESLAPENAEYIVGALDPGLTNERLLTDTGTISWDLTVPGIVKANTISGGGNVNNTGSPSNGQFARWTNPTTIEGISAATALTALGAQPLDADLTALAALTGTDVIYYRSAANTWTAVTIGTNLTFTGGTLSATGGGGGTGNVNYSFGTTAPVSPVAGDLWYNPTNAYLSIYVNDGTSSQWVQVSPIGTDTSAFVRTDAVQSFSDTQKAQARSNVYAAPFDAMAITGMQYNGAMEVGQEIAVNTATTLTNQFPADGWNLIYSGAPTAISVRRVDSTVVSCPPGFNYASEITITTANASPGSSDFIFFRHNFEGFRIRCLAFGTSAASPFTFSFWIMAGRAGSYSGGFTNDTRSYVFPVVINAANTWEYKSITVPGDTSFFAGNPWGFDNGKGVAVYICMMGGSTIGQPFTGTWVNANVGLITGTFNGAAVVGDYMRLTGVTAIPGTQGPTAAQSPRVIRPYDQELQMCQRYFNLTDGNLRGPVLTIGGILETAVQYPVAMRASPTLAIDSAGSVSNASVSLFGLNERAYRFRLTAPATGDSFAVGTVVKANARL